MNRKTIAGRRTSRRWPIWMMLAAVIPAVVGAGQAWEPMHAPDWLNRVELQEGDLLLTRLSDVVSALGARHVAGGRYSHALLVARDERGMAVVVHMQGSGLEAQPLARYLPRYARVAVVRLHAASDDADRAARLGEAARAWLARSRRERVTFQLDLPERDDGLTGFNCLALLNRIYRDAGEPEPFVSVAPRPRDAWTDTWARDGNLDLHAMPTAQDVLRNPRFAPVVEGENPDVDPRPLVVQDEIVDALHRFILAGDRLRPPARLSRTWLSMAYRLGCMRSVTRDLLMARASFLHFSRQVNDPLSDYIRRHPDADEETVRRIARRRCDALRPRYFMLRANGEGDDADRR